MNKMMTCDLLQNCFEKREREKKTEIFDRNKPQFRNWQHVNV